MGKTFDMPDENDLSLTNQRHLFIGWYDKKGGKSMKYYMKHSVNECERITKRVKYDADEDIHTRQRTIPSTDCYVDVTVDGIMEDDEGRLRQSWLTGHEWFSEFQWSPQNDNDVSRNIQTLEQQLLQVKRRLWPAAQKASVACTKAIGKTDGVSSGAEQQQHLSSPSQIFQDARRACDPMEVLGEGRAGGLNKLFVNRSAVKLANLNASIGFALTQPADTGSFHFVDLCAAPGGFSEYLFHHCAERIPPNAMIRGFGMSLMGTNEHGKGLDWKVDNYEASQMQYRICTGTDGTGDIYHWENTLQLIRDIDGLPIHTVVCDGGVDAQRDHEDQEALAQKLVICQVAAALSVLSPGGSFVVKLFGSQTDSVRSMMRDLSLRFQDMIITKPISSRPASAERYLVFVGFHGVPADFDGRKWRDAMFLGTVPGNAFDLKVESFLDTVDANMLQLNLRACFAILSKLERICQQGEQNDENHQHHRVHIADYRRVWKL